MSQSLFGKVTLAVHEIELEHYWCLGDAKGLQAAGVGPLPDADVWFVRMSSLCLNIMPTFYIAGMWAANPSALNLNHRNKLNTWHTAFHAEHK